MSETPHTRRGMKAEDTIERVYFPHSGIISLIVGLSGGQFVEAGVLGRNGVIGAGAALDGQVAFNTAIGQAEGAGTVIDAAVFGVDDTVKTFVELKGGPHGVLWTHADQVSRELVNFLA